MKVLLDTYTFLYFISGSPDLSIVARTAIEQQFQIQGSYPKYPATKVAATQTKPAQGGLRLPNWRVMTL